MHEHQGAVIIPRIAYPARTGMPPLSQRFLPLPAAAVAGLRGFELSRRGLQIPRPGFFRPLLIGSIVLTVKRSVRLAQAGLVSIPFLSGLSF
jgi:hypothetical protein